MRRLLVECSSGVRQFPATQTEAESTMTVMTVRTSVARCESTPWMPILAKIAVIAAKAAESAAQKNQ